jgi:ABC-type nitrate/sulfonate/bicarbonate transport system substrate-binding protein
LTAQAATTRRNVVRAFAGAGAAVGLGAAGTALAACGGPARAAGSAKGKVVKYQGSVGVVTPLELAESLGYLGDVRLEWIGNSISGPQDIQATVTGDTDIGGAFNGAIIRLVAAGASITSLYGYYGIDAKIWNGFYVREDSGIRGVKDLRGKAIGANTIGGQTEDVLKLRLRQAGLPDDAAQLVVVPPVSAEASLRSGQLDVAVLGGTLRDLALSRGGIRPVFTDYGLLGAFTCGCHVMRDQFIRDHPDTVRAVVSGVARAVAWSQTQPRARVIRQFARVIDGRGRQEDTSQLKFWLGYGIAERGGVVTAREFDVWRDRLVDEGIVGSHEARTADLYTNRFNPYAPGGAV